MLKYFICPNGLRTRIDDCLSSCRDRCLSKPTLVAIARGEREWTGVPSTTQLLGGTRLAYLKLTVDYAIEPESMAYALLGTSHHARLDKVAKTMNVLSEVKLGGDNTGIFDLLCEDETVSGDYYELWDYKTAGSFKIAQALGIVKEKKPDPTGATYMKDSKYGKKGEVKQVD
ncbi:MAG: hypothetical protein KKF21_19860, partial [Bacteroidetes bacterium]|nr:hypothetical protein [Bacteroidota bacterium]